MVTIELRDGRRLEGRLEKVGSTSIEVRREGGQAPEALERDQIVSVEQRKVSPIKTLLLVTGITVGLYAYAYTKLLVTILSVW